MVSGAWRAAKLNETHGYLTGNYAPVTEETPLTPCKVIHGSIPRELAGGQYVRNGGNPMADQDAERESHWFDGDGMLSGVFFTENEKDDSLIPQFTNKYIVTDVLLATSQTASRPILPSIATLASPGLSIIRILYEVMRSFLLCIATWIPWTWSLMTAPGGAAATSDRNRLGKISVANTSVYYHDGKVLAACESGPPIRVCLPELQTGQWWTGDEGRSWASTEGLTSVGPMKIFREMTTAHPHTDMSNNELLLYHSSFVAPYLRISVIPPRSSRSQALIGATVPGMKEGKLMHDFAATRTQTVMLDLPLSLDPRNLLKGKPIVHYDDNVGVRFGVFPRRKPEQVTWYSDPESCCIYHTANCWDEGQGLNENREDYHGDKSAVNFLACRLNSATLVYSVGNITPPISAMAKGGPDSERCELYYWRFQPTAEKKSHDHQALSSPYITHAFSLSRIPFEFPTINLRYEPSAGLGPNEYIYGCSMRQGTFDAGMGRNSAKIDCLVKMNAQRLVSKGRKLMDSGKLQKGDAVDERSMMDILTCDEKDPEDNIKIFALPPGHFAQESVFIPRANATSEDDGYLAFFVFDESTHLNPHTGLPLPNSYSELWIINAKDMNEIICKIQLPKRVPYGLHGKFFNKTEIQSQEAVDPNQIRQWSLSQNNNRQHEEMKLKAEQKRQLLEKVPFAVRPIVHVLHGLRSSIEALA